MDETHAALPLVGGEPAPAAVMAATGGPTPLPRWLAALQVFLVCGIPTQLVVAAVLALGFGMPMLDGANLSLEFFATVSLVDTALIAVLIRWFLAVSNERSTDVFVGPKPVWGEVWRGLALLPVVFLAVTGIVLGLRAVAPSLHTVDHSPLEAFMRTPLEAGIFLVVAVLAGGVREELQRAFILHRFDQRLGGVKLGLVLFSLLFGALHADQGVDVAIAVGTLGLLWGILYIKRGSAMMAMVNHASFNAAQVAQSVIVHALGG